MDKSTKYVVGLGGIEHYEADKRTKARKWKEIYCNFNIGLYAIYFDNFRNKKIHRQELPHDLKSEYEFNSGVTMHEKTYVSTTAIYFPESMRQKGDYVINNKTGYQICVATPQDGFLFFEQGEYRITGKPLVFFIVQPKEAVCCKGELKICESGEKIAFKYRIVGNQEKIENMRFAAEIV